MSADAERPEVAAETSPGRALALLALAPIATREADRLEQLDREERERQEAAERARGRSDEMEEALAEVPALPRPSRPNEPISASFDWERFVPTLWLIPVFLIFVGNLVSNKTIFDSGYPWAAMLLMPIGLAALNGWWPVLSTMPARERFRGELAEYEAATATADRRDAERAKIRESFEIDEPGPAPVDDMPPADAGEVPVIRVDGCYVADGPDYHYFLRFFPRGDVMTVTVSGTGGAVDLKTVRSVMGWLVPSSGDDGLSRGRLSQSGGEISFSATSADGTVNFQGTVLPGGEELRLQSHSLINGHRDERVWRFIAA